MARLRRLAEREHVHERLLGVGLGDNRMQVLRRAIPPAAHVDGRKNAAVHRHEVRREGDDDLAARGARELLIELGHVAMPADPIGMEAFRDFGKQHLLLGRAPCPGHAGLRVDHDLVRLDRLGF